jgi:hypothetical protein
MKIFIIALFIIILIFSVMLICVLNSRKKEFWKEIKKFLN